MNTAEHLNGFTNKHSTRWIASKSAVGCDIEGEMVLLDLQSGTYFGLNGVGSEIWNLLREETTLEDIQRHLLARYKVTPEQCATEVRSLLEQLREKGLVHTGDDESSA